MLGSFLVLDEEEERTGKSLPETLRVTMRAGVGKTGVFLLRRAGPLVR